MKNYFTYLLPWEGPSVSRSRRAEKREERVHTGAVSEEQVIQGRAGPIKEI